MPTPGLWGCRLADAHMADADDAEFHRDVGLQLLYWLTPITRLAMVTKPASLRPEAPYQEASTGAGPGPAFVTQASAAPQARPGASGRARRISPHPHRHPNKGVREDGLNSSSGAGMRLPVGRSPGCPRLLLWVPDDLPADVAAAAHRVCRLRPEWIELDGIGRTVHAPLSGRWLAFFVSPLWWADHGDATGTIYTSSFLAKGGQPVLHRADRDGRRRHPLSAAARIAVSLLYLVDPLAEFLFSLGTMEPKTAMIAAGLIAGVVLLASMYFSVRLALLAPGTAVEGRIDLRRTFALTRGNFWRLLGAALLVTIPMSVAQGFLSGFIAGISAHASSQV